MVSEFLVRELLDQYMSVIIKDCIRKRLIGSDFEHTFNVNVKLKHIMSIHLTLCKVYDMDTCAFMLAYKTF
jgi:hypothetical protein